MTTTENSGQTETARARSEHKKAWDQFSQVFAIHAASLHALRMMRAMPDAQEQFKAHFLGRKGFDPSVDREVLKENIDDLFDAVQQEENSGFQLMRSSALVAICGAFEFLLKAHFVASALEDVERTTENLRKQKVTVRIDAHEFLGLPIAEQWHRIADELYKKSGDGGNPMSKRVRMFLLEHTAMHPKDRDEASSALNSALSDDNEKTFNKAFLYRNCLVHNGARLSRELARVLGRTPGDLVELGGKDFVQLTQAIRKTAQAASPWRLSSIG